LAGERVQPDDVGMGTDWGIENDGGERERWLGVRTVVGLRRLWDMEGVMGLRTSVGIENDCWD
jgi:hypothetical protein